MGNIRIRFPHCEQREMCYTEPQNLQVEAWTEGSISDLALTNRYHGGGSPIVRSRSGFRRWCSQQSRASRRCTLIASHAHSMPERSPGGIESCCREGSGIVLRRGFLITGRRELTSSKSPHSADESSGLCIPSRRLLHMS
jgi:hypothetical protein